MQRQNLDRAGAGGCCPRWDNPNQASSGSIRGFAARLWGLACLLSVLAQPTGVRAAPIPDPASGHAYEAVSIPYGMIWEEAAAAASRRRFRDLPGHLATLTSPKETAFVAENLPQATMGGWWLGGFQSPGLLDPAAGWQWITGEPFSYTNWNDIDVQMPNDPWGAGATDDDQNVLQFFAATGGRWNDARPFTNAYGYVVEYEPALSAVSPMVTGYAAAERPGDGISSGSPGTLVRIMGTHLGQGGTVLFEGNPLPASVADWSATAILLWVPTAPSYPFRTRATVVVNGHKAPAGEFTITASAPGTDNLLANGSFEFPDTSDSPVDWGFTFGRPLDPNPAFFRGGTIPGWRIPHGTIDVKHWYWRHAPEQGEQSIDLVGSPGAAQIEQTVFTEPGRQYVLSGWMSHNPNTPDGRAQISLNRESFQELSHTPATSKGSMKWVQFTYPFRARDTQTTVMLRDVTLYNLVAGTAIDGLKLTLAPN
jgi:hypothetical protein